MRTSVLTAAALALAPVATLGGGLAAPHIYSEARGRPPVAVTGLPDLSPVARAVLPAVVGIATTQVAMRRAPPLDQVKDFITVPRESEAPRAGLATGILIHEAGWIVTNAHVVEGAARVEVDLGEEGGLVQAKLLGADTLTDIALLKVEAPHPLPFVALGDSDRLEIAEWLLVVGNPFGLARSVTLGIVSQLGRTDVTPQGKEGFYDFIQTDASINPGNSGGPLVNLRGEVVGIASAVNSSGQGIGFAIPINMVKQIVEQLREHGRVQRSWMGVSVDELPRRGAERGRARGVVVTGVEAGGPAESAGLAPGDVITSFDGRDVASSARLRWYAASAGIGRRVAVSVRRGEAERAVQVLLAGVPDDGAAPPPAGSGLQGRKP